MAKSIRILVVEDDKQLNGQIADLLRKKDYLVEQCFDGENGLLLASTGQFQLILLDVMLPERDGFSLLKMLRKSIETPVIMVTAKGAEQERIQGFSQGADDYIAKPFNTTEFLLRVEAILRRSTAKVLDETVKEIKLDNLIINANAYSVVVNSHTLDFTPTQFKLLWELILHQGEVLPKSYLYQKILNRPYSSYDRSLDMHLSRVRKKLNEFDGPGYRLQTSHGKGYCLV